MKNFILKSTLFILAFMSVYYFFINKLSKGYVDPYYNKCIQEAGGLIIGLSRANEGISPNILEKELNDYFDFIKPMINFGMNDSQFGEIYYQSIQEKIRNTSNGIFVISISPGNFTAPYGLNNNQIFEYDKKTKLGKIKNFTRSPNYNYILNNYEKPLYNTFFQLEQWNHRTSHSNGWNEIELNVKNDTISDNDIESWKVSNIKFYNEKVNTEQKAPYREDWFIKTLKYLKTKGKVVLVRIPSDKDVLEFENTHWNGFDQKCDSIASLYEIPYFNYSQLSNSFKTYDGSHLESESARKFTKLLSKDIKKYLLEKN